MAKKFGIPAAHRDPLAYADVGLARVPTVDAPRAPTTLDDRFPTQTIWRQTDPNDLTFFCEFILVGFNSNGAIWVKFASPSGGQPFSWIEETTTSGNFVANQGIITNNGSLVTLTLPTTCNVGESFRVAGLGAGGWRVAQNASQVIHFGNMDTTVGVTGMLDSTNRYDCIEFLCVVLNNEFVVLSSVGNITVT